MGNAVEFGGSGRTRILVEGALCVALSVVLSNFRLFRMPQGGSVTLDMAPLFFFAYRHGFKWGVTAGAISGIFQLIFGGYVAHPAQAFLEYPAAYAMLGSAGIFGRDIKGRVAGTLVASALRLACHVLAGVIFFAAYAPEGMNVWLYSTVYNGSYIVPATLISAGAALILWRRFPEPRL